MSNRPFTAPPRAEWLEADGLGGFASGTVCGVRTRRYHALLLAAATPPTGRVVLINGFEAWVETPAGSFPLSSQAYAPDIIHPDGASRIEQFATEPWPRWVYRLEDGTRIEQELIVAKGTPAAAVTWKLKGPGPRTARLSVRPLLSGRDYHALHHENGSFRFEPSRMSGRLVWRPYDGVPAISSLSNGVYDHEPLWFRNFVYEEEQARGLDCIEDLASPGILRFDLTAGEAIWIVGAGAAAPDGPGESAEDAILGMRTSEKRRRARLKDPLDRAADAFIVARGDGRTIVAGYPWFTDWGRDTFIAIRGLCLATGRLAEARSILVEWASAVSDGMLPNLFPDGRAEPEYNSVDASLWYVVAVGDFIRAVEATGRAPAGEDLAVLSGAVEAILDGYARGTRYGIRMDADGLLAAGVPGVQLTWMDARVGDRVVTPRIGKPVEVQALWVNALAVGAGFAIRFDPMLRAARDSFNARFWNEARGCLYDVVDVDHRAGATDATLRPNQIFAVGGLPLALLEGARARRVVDLVEAKLMTPLGPRSLAPGEPGYAGRYEGGPGARDAVYHQGTVWPWLAGAFADAWVKVRGGTNRAKREARGRFLAPLFEHMKVAGLGSVSEIADADPPHSPRGCPFQAWSVGEAIRMDRILLKEESS